MIIDFHTHTFPDELALKALPALEESAGSRAFTNGTINGLKKSMKRAGIDLSCVLSIATKPSQTEHITLWSELITDSQIIGFSSLHPNNKNFKSDIRKMKEKKIKGVKFHPDYQNFFVDEKRMYPIYEELIKENMIIVFHAGVDIGLPKPYHCTPIRLKCVLDDFQGGKFVAAHMGGYSYWDDVEKYLVGMDCYLDTSYTLGYIDNSRFIDIIRNHGVHKILFATDSPWRDQKTEVKLIKELKLSEVEEKLIFSKNAEKLLELNL